MGMEFWLIPVLAVIAGCVAVFYMILRYHGGSGVRADGHTVMDKAPAEENRQCGWNYYK
jgi:hypothetical protein